MPLTGVVLTGVVCVQAVKYLSHLDNPDLDPIRIEMEGHVAFHIVQDGDDAVITYSRNGQLVEIERRPVKELVGLPIMRAMPELEPQTFAGSIAERLRRLVPF